MTTAAAIQNTRFWLDQYDTWFQDYEVVMALNRAIGEWVVRKYESGIATERDEADLAGILPLPIVGSGNRVVLGSKPVLYILAVTAQYKGADGGLSSEIPVRPVKADRLATSKNSLFHRPTSAYPLYQRSTDNVNGLVLDLLTGPSTVDTHRVYYLLKPQELDDTKPTVEWSQFSKQVQNEIIQHAKRMLLAAKLPDYQAQVAVEQPLAGAQGLTS